MWTCDSCNRTFKKDNQHHYCGGKSVGDFLKGKSEISLALLDHLLLKLSEMGELKVHATRSMLVLSAETRFAYVIQIGKNFIDVVLPFKELYNDNLCFRKMGQVPGSNEFNHHLRIMTHDDFNDEVCEYLAKAYANGKML